MGDGETRVWRYVLVVDRGDPRRLTGLAVAAMYTDPGERTRRLGFFHFEEPPGDLPGRAVGARIAELVRAMDPGVPVHVMCGVSMDGREFAKQIIWPAAVEALGDAGAAREVTWETYAAHVRGGVREVGRKISLTKRIAALSIALELRTVVIPQGIPLADSMLKALKNYDPSNATTEAGDDKWNAIPHEGLITAIAAAHTTLGEAQLFVARGGRGDAYLEETTHGGARVARGAVVAVPETYVEGGVGGRVSGTVLGGSSGIGGRWAP
ncbi:hypothetical protein [Streptomyces noursei]